MPNLKNKTKFTGSSVVKNSGWLEKYGDGGLKSVTGPAPKFDAKTEAEGKRIASGYNNANKQNAQISQTRNWSQADQEHSDRVKARINNPASDIGILAANMASNLTRFRNLTPEEIARVTDNVGETVNLSSGIATDALTNELVGYGATKAIPFVSKSAKAAGKYLTEETALKNAYKLNPFANKNPLFSNLVKEGEVIKHPFRNQQVPIEKLSNEIDYFHLKADPENIPYSAAKNTDTWNQLNKDSRFFVKRTDNTPNAVIDNPISYGDDLSDPRKLPIPMNELYKYRSAENLTGKPNWLKGYPKFSKELLGSSNVENLQKAGIPNPLKIVDNIIPRTPAPGKYIGMEDSWNNYSPLNLIPGYGKKLSQNSELYSPNIMFNDKPALLDNITSSQYPVGFRKFGNSIQDVIDRKVLGPRGKGFGSEQIIKEGNWSEAGKVNENYPGLFEATMNPNVKGSNIKLEKWHNRNGIVGTTKEGNVDIPLTDPGLSFNRRLPFSNKYVSIDKQKLIDNKFQLATQLPHVQSLIEKYGIIAGQAAVFGYLYGGKDQAIKNLKTVNKYSIDPVANWTKKQWEDLKKSDFYKESTKTLQNKQDNSQWLNKYQ
jgi:hypothetical protein